MHLFADISSHGFGHLAISAPVLNALAEIDPDLQLTVRSGLAPEILRQRIRPAFEHIRAASDFGYVMQDATRIDHPASARAYRAAHAGWAARVAGEGRLLASRQVDRVLSNVSYLPLAGAALNGIPALSICSLNWADLFAHFFGHESWAAPIHADMLDAYRDAWAFLRVTPGMPMERLGNVRPLAPIAARGQRHELGLGGAKAVLVAMGGIKHRVPLENWPRQPGIRWLVPASWQCTHPDALAFESLGIGFTDLLCSVDAIITKPGYGTFTEAACNGTPVLYQRRADWPEQDCLIAWLGEHGNCREIDAAALNAGEVGAALEQLWQQPARPLPPADGAAQAAALIMAAGR